MLQTSADAAVQAWMKALAGARGGDDGPSIDGPLSERQVQLVKAFDRYLRHAPADDPQRVGVMFSKAKLLRTHGRIAEAIPMLEDIVAHHADHETAEYAAQLVMDGYNQLGRHAEMLAFARGLPAALLDAHPAVADTVHRLEHVAARLAARQLEDEGRRTGALARFIACGERYLALYNAAPEARDADEPLYSAGVCFEDGKALGAAIAVYERLIQLMPSAPSAGRALARLGNVYATTAQYRLAAERLERYAAEHAGQRDAGQALSDAVQLRKGLGDDAQAIADTERFVARFGGQRVAEAADAFYSLIAIYEKQAEAEPRGMERLARHLRAYLDRYGATGGAARQVIAWAKLGDVLWRQACPVPAVDGRGLSSAGRAVEWQRGVIDGVCAREVRGSAARGRRCGDEARSVLRIVPRDAAKTRAALDALDRAIQTSRQLDRDDAGGRSSAALARFVRRERDYEQYLALALPAGLDFDPARPAIAARSRTVFDAWARAKAEAGGKLRRDYEAMIRLGDGAIAIAAGARIAAISQHAAGQLYRAEIPADVRRAGGEAGQAYCDALEQRAQPLEAAAVSYYQACLATSTRLGWFSRWSRICERELGRLLPAEFPSTLELRAAPAAVALITTLDR